MNAVTSTALRPETTVYDVSSPWPATRATTPPMPQAGQGAADWKREISSRTQADSVSR